MKSRMMSAIALNIMLLSMCGCGRIIDWAMCHFDQGEKFSASIPAAYLRCEKVYDEFSTIANFEVLWLSDEVRMAYAQLHACKQGKTDILKQAFMRRQLEENRHFISFYVLTNYTLSFGEPMSDWSAFLDTGMGTLMPAEIKIVDLAPEYKLFFGNKFNRFKTAYIVKFNAADNEGNPLIGTVTPELKLYFRSVDHQVTLCWTMPDRATVALPEQG